jgi:DHA1 family multidrug resistance protein-like MFS transporter
MPFTTILGASDIFRDSVFGHLVRVATSDEFFYYDEERDSSLWKKFVNEGKSGNLAHHVTADDLSDNEDRPSRQLGGIRTREARNVSEDSEKIAQMSKSQTRQVCQMMVPTMLQVESELIQRREGRPSDRLVWAR